MIITHNGTILTNDGVVLNNITTSPSFQNTYSLDFDGVDDYVSCGNITELDNVTSATWSIWSNSLITTSYHYLMSCYSTGFKQYLFKQSTNKLDIFLSDSGSSLRLCNTINFTFTVGVWFHIAIIYDETEVSNADKVKVYIDGVLQTNTVAGFALTSLYVSRGNPTEIGKAGGFTSNQYNGNLDEVCILDRAATPAEIVTLSTAPTVSLTDLNPIAWYRNGDNGSWKSPQWLIPNNENKDKVSNYSLDFDGVDDKVELGTQSFGITGAISVSAWVKIPLGSTGGASPSVQVIAAEDRTSGTNRNWLLFWRGGSLNQFGASIWDSLGTVVPVTTTAVVPNDGNWHHVMITYTGDISTDGFKLFVDGIQRAQATSSNGGLRSTTSVVPTIGSLSQTIQWQFEGNIDEVAIFDTDQSSNISSIYNGGEPTTISGAIAHYKMGEDSNFTSNWLVDNSALDNYSKRSFSFDGVDDFIDCGNGTDLQITGAFTLSIWTKLDSSVGTQACAISKDNGTSQRAFTLWSKIVNKPVFYIWNGATSYNVGGITNIADDTWHHVAVVYVPSTSIRIYVDGVLEGTNTTSIPASINNANYNFKIGEFAGSLFEYKGLMDEVSVFDSDQSANISSLYNGGTPTTLPSGAVAHWRMGEDASFNGTNWTVPDNVGSNNGTSANMDVSDLVGEAPNYSSGGISANMNIFDRVGEAPNSSNNALSLNMDEVDRVEDTPPT